MRDGQMGKGAVPVRKITGNQLIQRYRAGDRDFTGANLREANLQAADLNSIVLNSANLQAANLYGAD